MNPWLIVAAALYLGLAVGHTWLGERKVIRPLLAADWEIGLPRGFVDPLLRMAWHGTSLAWLAAAVILGFAGGGGAMSTVALDVLGALAIATGLVIGIGVRGAHFAWAFFVAAGLAAFAGAHGFPTSPAIRIAAGGGVAAVLGFLGALHLYWMVGGRWGAANAVPTNAAGKALFRPSRGATMAVALLLFAAAITVASAAGIAPPAPGARALGLVVAVVFGARVVGDFRFVGLFKRERRSSFARWDSMLFSPLSAAIAVASAIAAA